MDNQSQIVFSNYKKLQEGEYESIDSKSEEEEEEEEEEYEYEEEDDLEDLDDQELQNSLYQYTQSFITKGSGNFINSLPVLEEVDNESLTERLSDQESFIQQCEQQNYPKFQTTLSLEDTQLQECISDVYLENQNYQQKHSSPIVDKDNFKEQSQYERNIDQSSVCTYQEQPKIKQMDENKNYGRIKMRRKVRFQEEKKVQDFPDKVNSMILKIQQDAVQGVQSKASLRDALKDFKISIHSVDKGFEASKDRLEVSQDASIVQNQTSKCLIPQQQDGEQIDGSEMCQNNLDSNEYTQSSNQTENEGSNADKQQIDELQGNLQAGSSPKRDQSKLYKQVIKQKFENGIVDNEDLLSQQNSQKVIEQKQDAMQQINQFAEDESQKKFQCENKDAQSEENFIKGIDRLRYSYFGNEDAKASYSNVKQRNKILKASLIQYKPQEDPLYQYFKPQDIDIANTMDEFNSQFNINTERNSRNMDRSNSDFDFKDLYDAPLRLKNTTNNENQSQSSLRKESQSKIMNLDNSEFDNVQNSGDLRNSIIQEKQPQLKLYEQQNNNNYIARNKKAVNLVDQKQSGTQGAEIVNQQHENILASQIDQLQLKLDKIIQETKERGECDKSQKQLQAQLNLSIKKLQSIKSSQNKLEDTSICKNFAYDSLYQSQSYRQKKTQKSQQSRSQVIGTNKPEGGVLAGDMQDLRSSLKMYKFPDKQQISQQQNSNKKPIFESLSYQNNSNTSNNSGLNFNVSLKNSFQFDLQSQVLQTKNTKRSNLFKKNQQSSQNKKNQQYNSAQRTSTQVSSHKSPQINGQIKAQNTLSNSIQDQQVQNDKLGQQSKIVQQLRNENSKDYEDKRNKPKSKLDGAQNFYDNQRTSNPKINMRLNLQNHKILNSQDINYKPQRQSTPRVQSNFNTAVTPNYKLQLNPTQNQVHQRMQCEKIQSEDSNTPLESNVRKQFEVVSSTNSESRNSPTHINSQINESQKQDDIGDVSESTTQKVDQLQERELQESPNSPLKAMKSAGIKHLEAIKPQFSNDSFNQNLKSPIKVVNNLNSINKQQFDKQYEKEQVEVEKTSKYLTTLFNSSPEIPQIEVEQSKVKNVPHRSASQRNIREHLLEPDIDSLKSKVLGDQQKTQSRQSIYQEDTSQKQIQVDKYVLPQTQFDIDQSRQTSDTQKIQKGIVSCKGVTINKQQDYQDQPQNSNTLLPDKKLSSEKQISLPLKYLLNKQNGASFNRVRFSELANEQAMDSDIQGKIDNSQLITLSGNFDQLNLSQQNRDSLQSQGTQLNGERLNQILQTQDYQEKLQSNGSIKLKLEQQHLKLNDNYQDKGYKDQSISSIDGSHQIQRSDNTYEQRHRDIKSGNHNTKHQLDSPNQRRVPESSSLQQQQTFTGQEQYQVNSALKSPLRGVQNSSLVDENLDEIYNQGNYGSPDNSSTSGHLQNQSIAKKEASRRKQGSFRDPSTSKDPLIVRDGKVGREDQSTNASQASSDDEHRALKNSYNIIKSKQLEYERFLELEPKQREQARDASNFYLIDSFQSIDANDVACSLPDSTPQNNYKSQIQSDTDNQKQDIQSQNTQSEQLCEQFDPQKVLTQSDTNTQDLEINQKQLIQSQNSQSEELQQDNAKQSSHVQSDSSWECSRNSQNQKNQFQQNLLEVQNQQSSMQQKSIEQELGNVLEGEQYRQSQKLDSEHLDTKSGTPGSITQQIKSIQHPNLIQDQDHDQQSNQLQQKFGQLLKTPQQGLPLQVQEALINLDLKQDQYKQSNVQSLGNNKLITDQGSTYKVQQMQQKHQAQDLNVTQSDQQTYDARSIKKDEHNKKVKLNDRDALIQQQRDDYRKDSQHNLTDIQLNQIEENQSNYLQSSKTQSENSNQRQGNLQEQYDNDNDDDLEITKFLNTADYQDYDMALNQENSPSNPQTLSRNYSQESNEVHLSDCNVTQDILKPQISNQSQQKVNVVDQQVLAGSLQDKIEKQQSSNSQEMDQFYRSVSQLRNNSQLRGNVQQTNAILELSHSTIEEDYQEITPNLRKICETQNSSYKNQYFGTNQRQDNESNSLMQSMTSCQKVSDVDSKQQFQNNDNQSAFEFINKQLSNNENNVQIPIQDSHVKANMGTIQKNLDRKECGQQYNNNNQSQENSLLQSQNGQINIDEQLNSRELYNNSHDLDLLQIQQKVNEMQRQKQQQLAQLENKNKIQSSPKSSPLKQTPKKWYHNLELQKSKSRPRSAEIYRLNNSPQKIIQKQREKQIRNKVDEMSLSQSDSDYLPDDSNHVVFGSRNEIKTNHKANSNTMQKYEKDTTNSRLFSSKIRDLYSMSQTSTNEIASQNLRDSFRNYQYIVKQSESSQEITKTTRSTSSRNIPEQQQSFDLNLTYRNQETFADEILNTNDNGLSDTDQNSIVPDKYGKYQQYREYQDHSNQHNSNGFPYNTFDSEDLSQQLPLENKRVKSQKSRSRKKQNDKLKQNQSYKPALNSSKSRHMKLYQQEFTEEDFYKANMKCFKLF